MTRILFLGAPVEDIPAGLDHKQRFEKTGHNTGNLLIGCALRQQLAYSSCAWGHDRDASAVDRDFDLIAIAAANFIYEGFDFGWLADFLERTSLPILIVGLGAQLPSTASSDINLPAGSSRFLAVIRERCRKIGVRGRFTAEILDRLGVANTQVTGCPSFYWPLRPARQINKQPYRTDLRISVNGSRNVTQHSFSTEHAMRVEGELLRLSISQKHDYVLQNEFPEIGLLHSDEPLSADILYQLRSINGKFKLDLEPDALAAYIRAHQKVFFSVSEWADYIRTKDFSIGTRFHGNMIALQNDIPAVCVTHDSRTTEMCEFMDIPFLPVDRFHAGNLQDIYERADFGPFERGYAEKFSRYAAFLEENGAPHRLQTAG